MGCWFLRCGELWWVTCCPQDVEPAQAVDVRPDTIEDLALTHVVQGWPHQVCMIGLCLSMLGEIRDHGVSHGPACNAFSNLLMPPSIKICVKLPSPLWALSRSASSVGCSPLEDDLLESLEGVSSLGLGWHHFHWTDWIFSPESDFASVSLCVLKMWLVPVRVFWIGGHPCPSLPSDATWPSLKTSTSPLLAYTSSSSQGLSSSLWEGSDSLLVSWPSSVTWDWAEPDHWLRCEVILWAWLHD